MGLLILNLSFGFSLILKLFLITRLLIFSYHIFFTSHPVRMAIFLILICSFVRILIFKISYSWIFFLLILMFLGGVMVIVIYITSLAANEKNPYLALPNNLFIFFFNFNVFRWGDGYCYIHNIVGGQRKKPIPRPPKQSFYFFFCSFSPADRHKSSPKVYIIFCVCKNYLWSRIFFLPSPLFFLSSCGANKSSKISKVRGRPASKTSFKV